LIPVSIASYLRKMKRYLLPALCLVAITPVFAGTNEDSGDTGLKIASVVAMLAALVLAIRKLNSMKKK
jgi:hypothetical protein